MGATHYPTIAQVRFAWQKTQAPPGRLIVKRRLETGSARRWRPTPTGPAPRHSTGTPAPARQLPLDLNRIRPDCEHQRLRALHGPPGRTRPRDTGRACACPHRQGADDNEPQAPVTSNQHHRRTQCRKTAPPVGTQSAAQQPATTERAGPDHANLIASASHKDGATTASAATTTFGLPSPAIPARNHEVNARLPTGGGARTLRVMGGTYGTDVRPTRF